MFAAAKMFLVMFYNDINLNYKDTYMTLSLVC